MPNNSVVVAIISPNRSIHRQLESALGQTSLVESVLAVHEYPEIKDLSQLGQTEPGCVLFLDFADPIRARRIATEIDRSHPKVSVVAIHNGQTKDEVLSLMQVGIRELIGTPVSAAEVGVAFLRAATKITGSDVAGGNIYAFLPAKPGAGATTIAASTAFAVAEIGHGKTLLLDFDLRLGITSFLLQIDGRHFVQDALNAGPRLDDDLWFKLVCTRDGVDILGSAPQELPIDPPVDSCNAILGRAQAHYFITCVDLPGTLERHELEALTRAKEIFLVCTGDATGLHMARRKAECLQQLRLSEKVSVIINQATRRSLLPMADIEKLLQAPVRFTLPADPKVVGEAVQQGIPIRGNSPLAKQLLLIAKSMVGTGVVIPGSSPVRRFLEFFSISPERDVNTGKRG